jgi:hypothetical protein
MSNDEVSLVANERKINVNGEVWTWKIGRGGHVSIRDPNRKSYQTDQSKLTGLSWDAIERANWKGCNGTYLHAVRPAHIREFILNLKAER